MTISKNRYFGYRSFMPEYETMKRFREIGVDTFTFMVSNNNNLLGLPYTKYQPTWIWEREYDFTLFDKNVSDIVEAVPDAKLICFMDLNPPTWWTRRGRFGKRLDPFYDLGRIAGSTEWREDTAHYLSALLRHARERYADRIKAYIVAGGTTTEWFDSSCGEESIYRLEGFRAYMQEHGKPIPEDVPPRSVRYHGSWDTDDVPEVYRNYSPEKEYSGVRDAPSGMFRIPNDDSLAVDYWRFVSTQIADAVEFFIRTAREEVATGVELGVCFGYITDLGSFMRTSLGHLDYERIFSMPELDFALEPMSYSDRKMGGGPSTIIPIETLHTNGKRLLCSCDHATYTGRMPMRFPGSTSAWANAEEVVAGIKREMAFNLINGNSTWWFDMWGGWWDSPEAMATFKRAKEIWDAETAQDAENAAEILFLVDPENICFINDSRLDCGKFDNPLRKLLNHTGAPHAIASVNDLPKLDMSRFKLIVYCHPFALPEEKLDLLKAHALSDGRTMLWIYGPGIIHNGGWEPDNVERICGTLYKTPGVNTADMDGWRSVYVHDTNTLDAGTMRRIAEEAGCHIYCDKLRPVNASSRLVAVHTGQAEELTVMLPALCSKVVELYSGKTYTDTQRITFRTPGPDTRLFRLGRSGRDV